MKIYKNPQSRVSQRGSVVTIGSFDGVHFGHKVILSELMNLAKLKGLDSALITFFPHPRKVLGLDLEGFGVLNSLSEKEELLAKLGLDVLTEVEFTKEFSEMCAREFIERFFVDKLNAKIVIVGYDHQFGKDRQGGYELLQQCGEEFGFSVIEIAQQDVNNQKVSSTVVRNALKNGDVELAADGLGYRYFIEGEFNCQGVFNAYDDMKLFPKDGEYVVDMQSEEYESKVSVVVDGNNLSLTDGNMLKKYKKTKIIF